MRSPELALPLFLVVGKQASLTLLERMAAALDRSALAELQRQTGAGGDPDERQRREWDTQAGAGLLPPRGRSADGGAAAGRAGGSGGAELHPGCAAAGGAGDGGWPVRRCATVLKLAPLEEHAWKSHRLVLDGGTWRDVWEVIEGCLRAHLGQAGRSTDCAGGEAGRTRRRENGPEAAGAAGATPGRAPSAAAADGVVRCAAGVAAVAVTQRAKKPRGCNPWA